MRSRASRAAASRFCEVSNKGPDWETDPPAKWGNPRNSARPLPKKIYGISPLAKKQIIRALYKMTELNNVLISSGITAGLYVLWKAAQSAYHRYYLTSECANEGRTLEISIVAREPDPDAPPTGSAALSAAIELASAPRSRASSADAAPTPAAPTFEIARSEQFARAPV